jgi:hypothetical protein
MLQVEATGMEEEEVEPGGQSRRFNLDLALLD